MRDYDLTNAEINSVKINKYHSNNEDLVIEYCFESAWEKDIEGIKEELVFNEEFTDELMENRGKSRYTNSNN